jgi:16S rRNA (cytidine1402-2'-O)-methyltransferase
VSGILYIIPTPIGNLEDVTLRSLRILKECDLIACEDTRRSLKLLSHFGISTRLFSLHSYNEHHKVDYIIDKLSKGNNIAFIVDAGMPGVLDPGYILINRLIKTDMKFEVLPGATAVITALVASGFPTNNFIFCGFMKKQHNKIKKTLFNFSKLNKTIIFFESPYRLIKTIEICLEVFGGKSKICLAREMTKKFEEFIRGSISEILEIIRNKELFGEFVVLIYPKQNE